MSNIPTDISIKDLLTELNPKLTLEALKANDSASQLAGTEFTMVVDVSGDCYSYKVLNGADLSVEAGDSDNPMVRIRINKEDLQKMIQTSSLDMLIGIQTDLNIAKYNAIKSLRGSMVAELENEDGSTFQIEAIFNSTNAPNAVFKMKSSDSTALIKKETNPVNLFMSGAMKIEGDMAFAMATQPIFS